ncbi:MAG: fibronectin type III domain-containing protein [Ruminococcus sp.]|nr:fibronectin type III domain-containing protein [Ruminococcus sp.]
MRKQILSGFLAAVMAISCLAVSPENVENTSINADASSTVIYDASKMDTFSSRTKKSVMQAYYNAIHAGKTYVSGDSSTYYSTAASTSSPYNPGVPTSDTLEAMQEMTNFYRWLVGVNELKVDCTYSRSLQAQALDRNFEFGHYISNDSKPDDMSDELWAEGYACTHNILASCSIPSVSITAWMNEGYNLLTKSWGTLGHRYALINSELSEIQFGHCGHVSVGVCEEFENDSMSDAFAAFPAPGYMPNDLISADECAWSVELNTNVVYVADESDVTVTVKNLSTNKTYKYTSGELGSVGGTISFIQPDDYNESEYEYDDNYSVVITGLTDISTGKDAEIRYTVKFFDVYDYAEANPSSVPTSGHTYTTEKVAATYASKGYTLYTCSKCGYSYKGNYTAKKTVPQVSVKSKYTSTTSAVRINWTKVSGATGYRIYRYNSTTKKYEKVKTIKNGSTTTYKQTGLKAGTTYKYKVKAYVKYNGTNYWSVKNSSVIKTTTKPAQVTMKSASKSKTAVRINWKKVTGASGYQVQRYNSSTKKWVTVKTIKSGSTVTYKNTGLKKGTSYKYRVRAYRTVNGTKLYGKWSSTKKVTTKK